MGEIAKFGQELQVKLEDVMREINPRAKVSYVQLSTALGLIANGKTDRAAAIEAGIDYTTFERWKAESVTLYHLIRTCKEISKGMLMEAFINSATKTRVKKTVTTKKEQKIIEGKVFEVTHVEEKEQEVLPDGKTAKAALETLFPEEFGRIDRLKAMKIHSEASVGQIEDVGEIDELDPDQLTDVIDLMLDRGRFVVNNNRSIEEEYEAVNATEEKDEIEALIDELT